MEVKCRGCGQGMPDKGLASFKNMPKSAQFFPDEGELGQERGVDIVLRQCPHCGLVQAAGSPVPYYRDVVRAAGVSDEMRIFREGQYREWVQAYGLEGKKVVEIGAGSGEYMRMMEKAGAQAYGLEHLAVSVEKGQKAGHRMLMGFVEGGAYRIPGAPYDGFYSMNFLEHVPDPGGFLRGIAANLSGQAAGLVEVPNFDMVAGASLYSEFIQDHLSYFTGQTLRGLLERNGFEVLSCRAIWHGYILSATVRKRGQMDAGGFARKREALKEQVGAFLTQQEQAGKKVAVWGAGHQALANLSLLDMAGRVAYVVDSAKFKQGRYTPATHLPVVAPERLKEGGVQAVIVMAAGYSGEVRRIMQRDYPQIQCAVLTPEGLHAAPDVSSGKKEGQEN